MRPGNAIAYAVLVLVAACLSRVMLNMTAFEYARMFTALTDKLMRFTQ